MSQIWIRNIAIWNDSRWWAVTCNGPSLKLCIGLHSRCNFLCDTHSVFAVKRCRLISFRSHFSIRHKIQSKYTFVQVIVSEQFPPTTNGYNLHAKLDYNSIPRSLSTSLILNGFFSSSMDWIFPVLFWMLRCTDWILLLPRVITFFFQHPRNHNGQNKIQNLEVEFQHCQMQQWKKK